MPSISTPRASESAWQTMSCSSFGWADAKFCPVASSMPRTLTCEKRSPAMLLSAICSLICFIHTLWVLWLFTLVLFLRVCHNFNTLVAHTLQREVANARTQLNHWLRYVALWVEVGSVLHSFRLERWGKRTNIAEINTLSALHVLLRDISCEAYYCFHFRTCERCSMGYFFTECTVRHSFALPLGEPQTPSFPSSFQGSFSVL